jgi:protein-tyrosine phosphatase
VLRCVPTPNPKLFGRYDAAGIAHCVLRMDDDPRCALGAFEEPALTFLEEHASSGVLVHCQVGANRSVAIVLLFLMHRGVDLMSACEYVASARGHILGSGSFPAQLVSIARLRNKLGV